MAKKFRKDFEIRLTSLAKCIEVYNTTGNPNNVLPMLWHCLSYAYSKDVFIKSNKKVIHDVRKSF